MRYLSTRGGIEPVIFAEAVMMGLARDGGLLLPDRIPEVSDKLGKWRTLGYGDLAFEVMSLYADLPGPVLSDMIRRSYATFDCPEVAPVVQAGPVHVAELFHGPTLAFKDLALQFLGNLFEYILEQRHASLNILAATSGDTGSAAIQGVRGRKRLRIFVMHPHSRISRVQELQMTSVLDPNVFNLAIDGTFDDCQGVMKAIFGDLEFKDRYALGAVNSINWARLLAQVVYYFYAAFRVMERTGAERVRFTVPTGNFGNVFAGYLAARMGLPISRLVLATNENDILARFFNEGDYSLGPVHATVSPSMDIQVASNFERYLYYRVGEDGAKLSETMRAFARSGSLRMAPLPGRGIDPLFVAGAADTAATLRTIREFHERHGYLLDPHTAVGVDVALKHLDPGEPMICLATAHPAKFAEAIREATGKDIARHPAIDALSGRPTRCEKLPASVSAVREFIVDKAGSCSSV